MIAGKSVHNQRIESLWRDVYQGVLWMYSGLFHHMEEVGLLNPTDECHLFCLQYIYMPRINRHLGE